MTDIIYLNRKRMSKKFRLFFQRGQKMNPLAAKLKSQKKKLNFFKGISFCYLWLLLLHCEKKFFERYGVKQPFTVIMNLNIKELSKNF